MYRILDGSGGSRRELQPRTVARSCYKSHRNDPSDRMSRCVRPPMLTRYPISRIPSMPEWRCCGGRTLKQRHREFLAHFTSRLRPSALVLMIDQIYVEAFSSPVSKQEEWGNLYTLRNLVNGSTYEIVKNYPSDEELRGAFAGVCEGVRIVRTSEFWALSAQVRT